MNRRRSAHAKATRPSAGGPLTDEELRILCLPMAVDGDAEIAEARVAKRDTLEAWEVRIRDVCKHCGLRVKCAGCR